MNHRYPIVTVRDPKQAMRWFQENLFFEETDDPEMIQNGTCRIRFVEGTAEPVRVEPGCYGTGPAHIALRSGDIGKALAHCKDRGLALSLDEGGAFYNPKVYGEGEYYFNIASPFGLTVEISQRISEPHYGETRVIQGLDHIGLPSASVEEQLTVLAAQGFVPEFETVANYNEAEGRILCCMTRNGELVFEVYQFLDMMPTAEAFPNLTVANIVF